MRLFLLTILLLLTSCSSINHLINPEYKAEALHSQAKAEFKDKRYANAAHSYVQLAKQYPAYSKSDDVAYHILYALYLFEQASDNGT